MPFRATPGGAHMNGHAPRLRASLADLRLDFILVCVTLILSLSTTAPAPEPPDGLLHSRLRASLADLRLDFILVCVTLILSLSTTAPAQDLDEVSFNGVVTDENGAVITGARVTARFVSTGSERAAVTDEGGRYRLVELQPGAYTLRAVSAGFRAEERREVFTLSGQSV